MNKINLFSPKIDKESIEDLSEVLRRCHKCNKYKKLIYFYKQNNRKDGLHIWCKSCCSEYDREHRDQYIRNSRKPERIKRKKDYYLKNADYFRDLGKKNRQRIRDIVLNYYGPICSICGESNKEFLAIDHVYKDGAMDRKKLKGSWIEYDIIKNNFPNKYRILCHNCNYKEYLSYINKKDYTKKDIDRSIYRYNLKKLIFDHYDNKCSCCGFDDLDCLSIDHINGGGKKHRVNIGGASEFYPWLKRNNYPKEFRTLCLNCNKSLGSHNYCPHERINNEKNKSTPA